MFIWLLLGCLLLCKNNLLSQSSEPLQYMDFFHLCFQTRAGIRGMLQHLLIALFQNAVCNFIISKRIRWPCLEKGGKIPCGKSGQFYYITQYIYIFFYFILFFLCVCVNTVSFYFHSVIVFIFL